MMKRIIHACVRLFAVMLFAGISLETAQPVMFSPALAAAAVPAENPADGVLRLHIVANSDSHEDQRVKLLVRDALIKEFAPTKSIDEAEQVLLKNGAGMLETVEAVLRGEHCGYGAQLRFGHMDFPQKQYGDTVYPAGTYEALRVELGAAAGQNWWCVLFPPICLLDIGVTDIPDSDDIMFESDILALFKRISPEVN